MSVVENGEIKIKQIHFDDLNFHNIIPMAELERMYFEKVVEVHRYNFTQACKALGVGTTYFYNRLKEYGLKVGPKKELRKLK